MSLKVWLPLNGDLHNQGTSNIIVTNNGATVNTNGKIGSCYSFDGTDDYIQLTNFTPNGWAEFSLTAWVYPTADFNALFLIRGSGAHRINVNAQGFIFRDTNNSTQRKFQFSPTISLNTWTHIACVYKRGEVWLYQNGVLSVHNSSYYNSSSTLLNDMNEIRIARQQSTSANVYYTGKINDFRIYDHCLSAAEVHEISQGLVLHYKLDSGGTLCKTDLASWSKESGVTSTVQSDGSVKIDCTAKTSSRWGIYCDIQNVLPNTPYTFSIDCKTAHVDKKWQLSVGCNPVPSGTSQFGSNRATMNSTSGFTTYTATVTTNADTTWIRFYLAISCSSTTPEYQYAFVKNVKMTIGTSLQTTIQDSSGYGHNGTITGTPALTAETKRYSASTYFNGSSYILTPAGSFAWNDLTKLTLSAWIKPTASVSGWTGSIGIAADTGNTARGFSITDYANTFRVTYGNGSYATQTSGKTLTVNEWHHCAATLDGTTCNMYFDGALVKTVTIDWGSATLNTNARFQVGIDIPGTDEKFTGNYSDIRMYCTTLSAADIKQLYEVGAKVDNKHTIHSYELIESGTNKITRTGQLRGNNIHEIPDLFAYDPVLYIEPDGTQWAHIFHHNNPTSYKFASTDTFTSFVYTDENRWFNFAPCNSLSTYEIFAAVKKTSDAATVKYRWIQSASPMTATFDSTKSANVTKITTTGYTSCPFGGLYHVSGSSWLAMNNGTNNNWFGAVGCWTAWNGGIPGWASTASSNAITTGSIDIYVRIDNIDFSQINLMSKSIKTNRWQANNFIEL